MITNLQAEFWQAVRLAQAVQRHFNFSALSKRVQWGFGRVDFYGDRLYEPSAGGKWMAFVAPVVERGDLIDLCAIDYYTGRTGQRMGYGRGLGLDVVEKARQQCCDLRLVSTAMAWLRNPVDAVYLFNLADLPVALDQVAAFTCDSIELAERAAAFLPPSQRSRVQLDA